MKALSIKQPWASLIAYGVKDVENRTWKTNYRGRIFIHASKGASLGVCFTSEQLAKIESSEKYSGTSRMGPRSAIIGSVEIVDCVEDSSSIWAEPGGYHWILKNPVLFYNIIPCNGALSFWDPPPGITETISKMVSV